LETTRLEVAKSGDMAVLTGTYDMTMKDGSKDKGKYCEVWQKKSRGKMESWNRHVQFRSAGAACIFAWARPLRRENKCVQGSKNVEISIRFLLPAFLR